MPTTQPAVRDGNGVQGAQSLSRGLAILTAFSGEKREFSVAELAQHVEVSRPTAYRLAKMLEQTGFLQFHAATRTYSIGARAFVVGNLFLPASFSIAIGDIMRDLRAATSHTVHIAAVDDTSLLNVGAEESHNLARVVSLVGQRSPLHASAAGKAYLASLPTSEVLELMARTGMPRIASRTITDVDALLVDLEATRKRGYGVAIDERADGLHSFGISVGDRASVRPHTIAVSLPTGAMLSPIEEQSLVSHLFEAARRLAVVLAQYPR